MARERNQPGQAPIDALLSAVRAETADQAAAALEQIMEAERDTMIRENPGARRHDRRLSKVRFSGRDLEVRVPRVRMPDGKIERVSLYDQLKPPAVDVAAYRTAGVSTRGVRRLLDATSPGGAPRGSSSSSVQRQQADVAAQRLEAINSRWLGDENILAVMLDGTAIGGKDHKETVLVATGVTVDGRKLALGVAKAESEDHVLVEDLLADLAARGVSHRVLYVVDGGDALWKGIRAHWRREESLERGEEVEDLEGLLIQNCVVHFARKLRRHLPEARHEAVREDLYRAWRENDAEIALARLHEVADKLKEEGYTAAADSVRNRLEETLTVTRLGFSWETRQALRSTNSIESAMNSIERQARDVMKWMEGEMRRFWTAWALHEAEPRWGRIADPPDLLTLGRQLSPGQFKSADLLRRLPPTFQVHRAVVPGENATEAQRRAKDVVDPHQLARELRGDVLLGPSSVLEPMGLASDGDVTAEQLAQVFQGQHAMTGDQIVKITSHELEPMEGEAALDPVDGVGLLKWKLEASEPVAMLRGAADAARQKEIEDALRGGAHVALKKLTNNEKAGWDIASTAAVRAIEPSVPEVAPQITAEGVAFVVVRGRGKPTSPVTKEALKRSRAREAADAARVALNGRMPERDRTPETEVATTAPAERPAEAAEQGRPAGAEEPNAVVPKPQTGERTVGRDPPSARRASALDPVAVHGDALRPGRVANLEQQIEDLRGRYDEKTDEWLIATRTYLGAPFAGFSPTGVLMAETVERDLAIANKALMKARQARDEKTIGRLREGLEAIRERGRTLRETIRHPDTWMTRRSANAATAIAIERTLRARGRDVDWTERDEYAEVQREARGETLKPYVATLGIETVSEIGTASEWPSAWLPRKEDGWIASGLDELGSPLEDLTRQVNGHTEQSSRAELVQRAGRWLALKGEEHARELAERQAARRAEVEHHRKPVEMEVDAGFAVGP